MLKGLKPTCVCRVASITFAVETFAHTFTSTSSITLTLTSICTWDLRRYRHGKYNDTDKGKSQDLWRQGEVGSWITSNHQSAVIDSTRAVSIHSPPDMETRQGESYHHHAHDEFLAAMRGSARDEAPIR